MKRILFLTISLLAAVSCYDDSTLQETLKEHDARISALETLCAQLNTNIAALQTVVSALENNVYVTAVTPVKKGGDIVGYVITFTNSKSVTIYNGENGVDGKNGADGKDGASPLIGVRQDTDGIYYWTLNGEWLTDSTGSKVRASAQDGADGEPGVDGKPGADGVTPKLKIVDGYWYVSYDGGATWEEQTLGQATGDQGYTMFAEVTYDEENVYITMADGETITLPRCSAEDNNGMVGPANFSLEKVTATTAEFKGHVDLPKEELAFCRVILYYSQEDTFHIDDAIAASSHEFDENNDFEFALDHLTYNTEYRYCLGVELEYRGQKYFSENVMSFKTSDISIEVNVDESSITYSSALLSGKVTGMSEKDIETAGIEILYSSDYTAISEDDMSNCEKVQIDDLEDGGLFGCQLSLRSNRKYYYRYRFMKWTPNDHGAGGEYVYGEIKEFISPRKPTASEPANCYVVSEVGSYKFPTVKGNSAEAVGAVASAEVLWESFGTDVTPDVGDLVKTVSYSDGYITYQTADTFKEGNAVIAAKDASGNILWSWHIWMTDQPEGQVYYNGAGTMMDRNLGAASATPGDVGALGLLYQWDRKDPFLGSSSISENVVAASTTTWPEAVKSDASSGTIDYATCNPTTFITYNGYGGNFDWYYTRDSSTDNTRWTTSEKSKSIYDPCPAGWRVPDGGSNGVWSQALGSSSSYSGTYDNTNKGMNFSGKFGEDAIIWFPASGLRYGYDGGLLVVGAGGEYWSASPDGYSAYYLLFGINGYVNPSSSNNRAFGGSVRCLQE